jgi:hypothetical protein
MTHELLAHFIPQHIFDNIHCWEASLHWRRGNRKN